MMQGALCSQCIYYIKPSWWKRLKEAHFAERCAHPKERDAVNGEPTPCCTARINDCDGTISTLYRPAPQHSGKQK
jgi:hypothetical protein